MCLYVSELNAACWCCCMTGTERNTSLWSYWSQPSSWSDSRWLRASSSVVKTLWTLVCWPPARWTLFTHISIQVNTELLYSDLHSGEEIRATSGSGTHFTGTGWVMAGLLTLPIFVEASRFWGPYYDCTIWQCKLPIFHTKVAKLCRWEPLSTVCD